MQENENHPRTGDRLLKMAEVQPRLNLPLSSVYALVASGELPSKRVGPRTLRIRESDLEKYIAD